MQTLGANMRRGNEEVCVLEIVRPGMEDSESAKKQENTGSDQPARAAAKAPSRASFTRYGTPNGCLAQHPNVSRQPAAVGNGHGRRSIVSELLFTMNSATPTCRAVSRGKRAHNDTMTSRSRQDLFLRSRISANTFHAGLPASPTDFATSGTSARRNGFAAFSAP